LIGAELKIADVRTITPAIFDEIRQAAVDYQVVRIRGQQLESADVVAFAGRFGRLNTWEDGAKTGAQKSEASGDFAEIGTVSNVVIDGVPIGAYANLELNWHSDKVTSLKPPSFTVLYAVEAPSGEGETVFASVAHAAEALAPEVLERLSSYDLKNSKAANAAGLREGLEPITDVTTSPGQVHPLVTQHPETGRPVLFLGRRLHAYIPGLSVEESEHVLDEVWAHATAERFQWIHDWKPGDVVIFDNRSVLHGRKPFSPEKRRHLQQLIVEGERHVIPYGRESLAVA
jgi:taurine dioxygenase